MSMILVVEPDRSFAERLADALAVAGWETRLVSDRTSAIACMAEQQPVAVLVDIAIPEAEELLAACAAGRGGPGSIAVIPAPLIDAVSADDYHADAIITKPFSDEQLTRAMDACALMRKRRRPTAASGQRPGRHLSSADIFGDIVAEVESAARAEEAQQAAKPRPKPVMDDDLEERLQQTLSGFMDARNPRLSTSATAKKADAKKADDVSLDALLDRKLGALARVGRQTAKPVAPRVGEPSAQPSAPVTADAAAEPLPATARTIDAAIPDLTTERTADLSPTIKPVEPTTVEGASSSPSDLSTAGTPDDVAVSDPPSAPFLRPPPPLEMPASLDEAADPYRTQLLPTLPTDQEQSFGDYTLIDRIAIGGMAEVWKARRRGVEGFEKTVAIKRVLAHLTDSPELVSMLIDEAKLAARLSHPNIVQIYDLGKVDDDFFIAMELVDGTDLRSVLKSARKHDLPMPIRVALAVAARVARALDYAHRLKDDDQRELGLIHRDISPQNVLISDEGDIKLCDFGIAKAVNSVGHTQMGALKGKLQYMSPEQAWGKKLDARSDLFSLGSVLFEMLTGTKLFIADSEIGVLDAVRDCQIPHPRTIDPDIPSEAERIVLRVLAKAPEDRYQSAGALAGDLEALLGSLPQASATGDLAAYLERLSAANEGRDPASDRRRDSDTSTSSLSAVALDAAALTGEPEEQAFEAMSGGDLPARGWGRWWLIAAILAGIVLVSLWLVIIRQPAEGSASVPPPTRPSGASTTAVPAKPGLDSANTESASDLSSGGPLASEPKGQSTAPPAIEEAGSGQDTAAVDLEKLVSEELAKRTADIEARMRSEYEQEQQRLAEQLAEAQARAAAAELVDDESMTKSDDPEKDEVDEPPPSGGGGG